MKILHVITSLATGGAEKLMVDLLPRLRDKGAQVELAVFDGRQTAFMSELEATGIKIHRFADGGSVYNPTHILRLRRLMRRFDIVHTHNTSPQYFAAIASVFNKTRLITTEHSLNNRRRSMPIFRILDRWMYRRYDHIICIHARSESNLRQYLPGMKTEISTINNGINVDYFRNAAGTEVLNEIAGNDSRKIVMVAAFRWEKDQPTLIHALAELPEKFHLFLVGDGPRRAEFEQLISELGLTERVHLLGVRTDVSQILKSADYVVMSSHFEGFSLSSVEGMSSGRPVLASDIEVLHEVVGGGGILFEHENYRQLAEEIMRLEADPELYRQVAERCVAQAEQYDISLMADNYFGLYQRVMN